MLKNCLLDHFQYFPLFSLFQFKAKTGVSFLFRCIGLSFPNSNVVFLSIFNIFFSSILSYLMGFLTYILHNRTNQEIQYELVITNITHLERAT